MSASAYDDAWYVSVKDVDRTWTNVSQYVRSAPINQASFLLAIALHEAKGRTSAWNATDGRKPPYGSGGLYGLRVTTAIGLGAGESNVRAIITDPLKGTEFALRLLARVIKARGNDPEEWQAQWAGGVSKKEYYTWRSYYQGRSSKGRQLWVYDERNNERPHFTVFIRKWSLYFANRLLGIMVPWPGSGLGQLIEWSRGQSGSTGRTTGTLWFKSWTRDRQQEPLPKYRPYDRKALTRKAADALLWSRVGASWEFGATGPRKFDAPGLVAWLLRELGVKPPGWNESVTGMWLQFKRIPSVTKPMQAWVHGIDGVPLLIALRTFTDFPVITPDPGKKPPFKVVPYPGAVTMLPGSGYTYYPEMSVSDRRTLMGAVELPVTWEE